MIANFETNVERRTSNFEKGSPFVPQPMRRSARLSIGAEAIRSPRLVSPEEWAAEGVVGGVVGVDFETYYTAEYSVKALGTWAYCHDSRFDAYLVAVADSVKVCVCRPEDFPWETIEGLEWVSHNREFDRMVWERLVELGLVKSNVECPGMNPGQDGLRPWGSAVWRCSAAVCAFLQLPRDLSGAVEDIFGVRLDKTTRKKAKGKTGKNKASSGDSRFDGEMLTYAAKDAVACLALWLRLSDKWPERERRLFELTCAMGRKGLAMNWEYVQECHAEMQTRLKAMKDTLPWTPVFSIPKFRKACSEVGVPPPLCTKKDDPDFLDWLDEYASTPAAEWARILTVLRSGNRTEKVLASMLARRSAECGEREAELEEGCVGDCGQDARVSGDRMRYEMVYCGASTARWSGGGGLNMQNLNRSETAGVDLRRGIIAPPGHVLAAVDFAQIEARVLLWLAGDHETLGMLLENPDTDIYEVHARATMGWKPECGVRSAECGVEESLKAFCARTGSTLRQLAKARVLGLGFGCGPKKFVRVAKTMAGLELSAEEAERAVREYRESNPLVVGLWRRLDTACRAKLGGDYVLPLPSTQRDRAMGRYLIYRGLRWVDGDIRCKVGNRTCKVYGGLIAENWTQATARDVLADAWLRCVDAGFCPVLSVHDELVFELPEATAEADLARIVEIMEAPVSWAPGLPLKAEGTLMNFYKK